jgi:hypothetical protein
VLPLALLLVLGRLQGGQLGRRVSLFRGPSDLLLRVPQAFLQRLAPAKRAGTLRLRD